MATGGTIACRRGGDGLTPVMTPGELMEFVPEAAGFCAVDTRQILNIDSTNIRPDHWLLIARTIEEHYENYDGFVVCHGTDTMAYTAAALSYLIQHSPKPIAVTGAQRPIDMENTDARVNLADSLRFCCHADASGVCIVFDGKVICGTRARKVRTKSYNAFESINYPYIAAIRDGRVVQYIRECPPPAGPVFFGELNTRVLLLKLIPGMRPEILRSAAEHCDAVILESYGVGGIPAGEDGEGDFLAEVDHLVKEGKIVVMGTQVMHEGSDMTVYQVGHVAKETYGMIETFDMTLEAAVTKLMWILARTRDPKEVRRLFYATVSHDILFSEP